MRKGFILIRAKNLRLLFLYELRRFQNRNLLCFLQMLFTGKQGLAHLNFLNENESLQHCLS